MNLTTKVSSTLRHAQSNSPTTLTTNTVHGSIWVTAFIISLAIPIQIYLGDIRLSFYRIVLLFSFFSILAHLVSKPIRLCTVDILIIAFALMGALSLIVTRASTPTVGIFILETLGPYFLARIFIRNSLQFCAMVKTLTACIIVTIPFAIFENLTGNPILLSLLGKVLSVLPNVPHEQRLGLDRAQVTFDHPILYGVFCSFGFALALYAARPSPPEKLSILRASLVGLAAFLSLSSGALVAVGLQGMLTLYDVVFRKLMRRWMVLATTVVIVFIVVEAFSNRSVAQIAVPYLALNPGTGYTRLLVNDWAISGIMERPWFGYGFTYSWPAPWWLVTTSIDNFWLAMALRHGLLTVLLLIAGIASLLFSVIFTRQIDPFVRSCRTGYVITVISVCMAVISVHLWNSTYCAFIFLLGCGVWMTKTQEDYSNTTSEIDPPRPRQQASKFTRFERTHPPLEHR